MLPFNAATLRTGENRLPCPQCDRGPKDKALSVRVEDDGRMVWTCHRCGWSGAAGRETQPAAPARPPSKAATKHRAGLAPWADREWATAQPIHGAALAYLKARACCIPPEGSHLRYNPSLHHPSGYTGPGLVALVTDARTGQPISLHRTWVRADGEKAPLEAPRLLAAGHRKAGGVIRLWPRQSGQPLGIAEGIETALSLAHADVAAWAAIDAGNLAALPVLPGVPELLIAVDADPAGEAAAAECSSRWLAAGRRVRLVRPDAGDNDLNDTAQKYAGHE
ncbi:MAG: toprim domain-containing protein [Thiomonas sp.]|uniref:toprim domain-containing protein n=1 Tax=Thiomonas sp. TaxID=2047785 RepID=UPI002A365593|nr:toprim domain-containing protein [Thiomonas sp.]MDY0328910.1 toprim domain-containing protein [Thiomonas sp.]